MPLIFTIQWGLARPDVLVPSELSLEVEAHFVYLKQVNGNDKL
jgi:hypothetical protein